MSRLTGMLWLSLLISGCWCGAAAAQTPAGFTLVYRPAANFGVICDGGQSGRYGQLNIWQQLPLAESSARVLNRWQVNIAVPPGQTRAIALPADFYDICDTRLQFVPDHGPAQPAVSVERRLLVLVVHSGGVPGNVQELFAKRVRYGWSQSPDELRAHLQGMPWCKQVIIGLRELLQLDAETADLLASWVGRGMGLIVLDNAASEPVPIPPQLRNLISLQLGGKFEPLPAAVIEGLGCYPAPAILPLARTIESVQAQEGSGALPVVTYDYGLGKVTVCGFDLFAPSLAEWAGAPMLWRQILRHSSVLKVSASSVLFSADPADQAHELWEGRPLRMLSLVLMVMAAQGALWALWHRGRLGYRRFLIGCYLLGPIALLLLVAGAKLAPAVALQVRTAEEHVLIPDANLEAVTNSVLLKAARPTQRRLEWETPPALLAQEHATWAGSRPRIAATSHLDMHFEALESKTATGCWWRSRNRFIQADLQHQADGRIRGQLINATEHHYPQAFLLVRALADASWRCLALGRLAPGQRLTIDSAQAVALTPLLPQLCEQLAESVPALSTTTAAKLLKQWSSTATTWHNRQSQQKQIALFCAVLAEPMHAAKLARIDQVSPAIVSVQQPLPIQRTSVAKTTASELHDDGFRVYGPPPEFANAPQPGSPSGSLTSNAGASLGPDWQGLMSLTAELPPGQHLAGPARLLVDWRWDGNDIGEYRLDILDWRRGQWRQLHQPSAFQSDGMSDQQLRTQLHGLRRQLTATGSGSLGFEQRQRSWIDLDDASSFLSPVDQQLHLRVQHLAGSEKLILRSVQLQPLPGSQPEEVMP